MEEVTLKTSTEHTEQGGREGGGGERGREGGRKGGTEVEQNGEEGKGMREGMSNQNFISTS